MKKLIITFLCILSIYIIGVQQTFATRVDATIVGTTTSENGGTITFSTTNVAPVATIDGTKKWAYIGTDNKFYGYFRIQNVGWATFDGLGGSQASIASPTGTNITVSGYAWSENAGWIAFINGVNDTKYNANTGKFSGFARSENLGWIDMGGITGGVDITPPTFPSTVFVADNNKPMTITDVGGTYQVQLDNYSSTDSAFYSKISPFNHDFRKAKDYNYILKDLTGNYTTGVIHVVANVPNTTLNAANIGVPKAAIFPSTSPITKIADGTTKQDINIELRDTYGNPVINDTTTGKTVTVNIAFANDIKQYQYPITSPLYIVPTLGMINFYLKDFGLNTTKTQNVVTGLASGDPNGIYNFQVSSYAPTTHANGGSGSLKLTTFTYNITGGANVGGITSINIPPITYNFSPAYYVSDMTVSGGFNSITPNNTKFFTGSILNPGSTSAQKIAHIFDINNPTTIDNVAISLQNPTGTFGCNGFYNQSGAYISTNSNCDYSHLSSNTYGSDNTFSWTPKLNLSLPAPASMTINYNSLVTYNNNGTIVGHESLKKAGGVTNNQIKVTGKANDNSKNLIVQSGSNSINIIGTINKNDLKTTIYKNVELLTKNGVPDSGTIKYQTSDFINLSSTNWPSGKDTIIIKGANVYITGDIPKINGKVKGLVVLKNNGVGGNIYIKDTVKYVALAIFADGGLISGDGTTYYADSDSLAQNQMFFKGTIISNNTIGGSYKNPFTCPYGVTPCTETNSKRYDLNLFRHYINGVQGCPVSGGASPCLSVSGVNMTIPGYSTSPIIIEYDSDIQSNPPAVFKLN
ncbi:MAG: hypothetical protein PHZ26_01125 [Candidatus Gracilibacteria bacterium]|nr:hypothetical protein [Candidatus Gracilibacteria bacterium]MDD2908336.1 hypothetical protein [Candidatus Gracilibacteria bacterium]